MPNDDDLEKRFTYHPPKDVYSERPLKQMRFHAKILATFINEVGGDRRETSLAITKIEEAVMWADAAFSRSEEARESHNDTDDQVATASQ